MCVRVRFCVWVHTVCFSTCACVLVGIGRNHWEVPSVFRHHTVNVWTTILQVISYRWLPSLRGLCLGEAPQCVPPLVAECSGLDVLCAQMVESVCYRWSYASFHIHIKTHTVTHKQSHPTNLLSFTFAALLRLMLGPHFVSTSTYPPSVVSRLAQVCTVGLLSIQGVSRMGWSVAQSTVRCTSCFIRMPNWRPTGGLK